MTITNNISKNNNDLDNPQTTISRSKILNKKLFLKNVYINFYRKLDSCLTPSNRNGYVVELGSGGGFIKKHIPNTITSDILKLPKIDMHFSATKMPFKKSSVNAFVMIDVFHHIDNVELFLKEADRCLKKGGQIIMIEPANTFFGKFIYKYFHHEPYNLNKTWSFASTGPLSGANLALPWVVFIRDKKKFQKKFINFKLTLIEPHTPIKYLLSGGFSYPQLLPNIFYPIITFLELLLKPFNSYLGMFYLISIKKS